MDRPQGVNCVRCIKRFLIEEGAGIGYCPECVEYFKKAQTDASENRKPKRVGKAKITVAEPSRSIHPRDCPLAITSGGKRHCGCCGSTKLEAEYGLSPFGTGSFDRCGGCKLVLNFIEDTGD